MKKYSKYVNAIFLLGSLSFAVVFYHYLLVVIGYFQLGRSIGPSLDILKHVAGFVVAIGTFLILKSNNKASTFTSEAVHELLNVSWPKDKEVRVGTVVVIITVLASGFVLGVLDLGLTSILRTVLGA